MSLYQLSSAAAQTRLITTAAAGGIQAKTVGAAQPADGSQAASADSTQTVIRSLTQFVPTEIVSVFILGITLVTSSFKTDTALIDPVFHHQVAGNAQAWFAWAWFDACLAFTVIFYYIGFLTQWRSKTGGAWPHLRDCFTGIALWQAIASAIAFFLWGLSVAPSNVLLYPSADGKGVDPRPFAALASLLVSPFFSSVNNLFLPPASLVVHDVPVTPDATQRQPGT